MWCGEYDEYTLKPGTGIYVGGDRRTVSQLDGWTCVSLVDSTQLYSQYVDKKLIIAIKRELSHT